jgi:hypothetical protein
MSSPSDLVPDESRADDELVDLAMARMAAVERGEMGTTSLGRMIEEFAPELNMTG